MKIFLPVFLIFLCVSCGDRGGPVVKKDSVNTVYVLSSLKERLLKIIEGGWVNETYMTALQKTSSPMQAAADGGDIQQMSFDISNLSGDTLFNALARMKYNENDRFDVIFSKKKNGGAGMWLFYTRGLAGSPLEMNYEITGTDTVLLVYSNVNGAANTLRFHRQSRSFQFAGDIPITAMEYYVNKLLFAGEWKNGNQTVTFHPDGEVENFRAFYRYSVMTIDPQAPSHPDEISFYNDTSGVSFVFTIHNDKLRLYQATQSKDGIYFSRGKMVSEFTRSRLQTLTTE